MPPSPGTGAAIGPAAAATSPAGRKRVVRTTAGQIPVSPPSISANGFPSSVRVTSMLQQNKPLTAPHTTVSKNDDSSHTGAGSAADQPVRRSLSLTAQADARSAAGITQPAATGATAVQGGTGTGAASAFVGADQTSFPGLGRSSSDSRASQQQGASSGPIDTFGSLIDPPLAQGPSPLPTLPSYPAVPVHAPASPGGAAGDTRAEPSLAASPPQAPPPLPRSHSQPRESTSPLQLSSPQQLGGGGLEDMAPKQEPSPSRDSVPNLMLAAAAAVGPTADKGSTLAAQATKYTPPQPRHDDDEGPVCCPIWPL